LIHLIVHVAGLADAADAADESLGQGLACPKHGTYIEGSKPGITKEYRS
jgi:hypothetical protein